VEEKERRRVTIRKWPFLIICGVVSKMKANGKLAELEQKVSREFVVDL
jgi:hypothetical protein